MFIVVCPEPVLKRWSLSSCEREKEMRQPGPVIMSFTPDALQSASVRTKGGTSGSEWLALRSKTVTTANHFRALLPPQQLLRFITI